MGGERRCDTELRLKKRKIQMKRGTENAIKKKTEEKKTKLKNSK